MRWTEAGWAVALGLKTIGSLRWLARSVILVVITLNQTGFSLFQITRNIWQGRFAADRLLTTFQFFGITHILNVAETPNQLTENDGPFKRIAWTPIEDGVNIPQPAAIQCVDALHECVCDNQSNVYIHCVAGWNRSPTFHWLYLVACGVESDAAINMITKSSFDAVPAHPKLINTSLVDTIIKHGELNFQPHPRPTALEPPIAW